MKELFTVVEIAKYEYEMQIYACFEQEEAVEFAKEQLKQNIPYVSGYTVMKYKIGKHDTGEVIAEFNR